MLLDLCIDVSGQVKTVQIVRSSGHVLLDRAAAKAVQGWRFSPSTKDGIPVEGSLRLPVEFHLRQQQNAGGIFRMANGWAVGLHRAS